MYADPMRSGSQEMSDVTGRPNRRVVLLGAGACGVIGASAACDSARAEPASPGTAPTPAASTGDVLAATKDVPVGGGIVVARVLIVQPASGTFKAFDAACPHRGVLVGPPANGISTCPAHHSTFAVADGSRMSGPATQGLTEIAVSIQDGNIVRA